MKRVGTLLLLGGITLTASAQQIKGDFDADWHNCTPWTSDDNTTEVGAEPEGWFVSNVRVQGFSMKINVGDCVTRSEDPRDQAVKLTNREMWNNRVPGYITLGTPWATAEVKGFGNIRNTDGGTFGGIDFTFRPDSISFEYQRDNSHGEENATVVAYLWKGTWTQKDVPATTIYKIAGWPAATTCDMADRDRNVLGIDPILGGAVSKTDGAQLVAYVNQPITGSTGATWKTMTIPFTYNDKTATVEKLNVIFSAADYFGDRENIVGDNTLTIDNVRLIYNHELSSLSTTDADGNEIDLNETFSKDRHDYTVDATYDDFGTEVKYESTGVGATVSQDYDDTTGLLTITVKGADYDADKNADAKTVYTIQYKKPSPKLTSLVISGREFIAAGVEENDLTATGLYNENEVSYKADQDNANVDLAYDKDAKKLTVTLTSEGADASVYTITFEGKQKEAVYQIPNSDFENWNTDDENSTLAESWNSFESATGTFAAFASMSPLPEKIEGYKGNGVRIVSRNLFIANANGNLTTGHISIGSTTPTDAANFNFTDRTDVNGNLPFAGKPDAFEVYARFTPGTATDETIALNGRVQLIMHGDVAYHDPELEDMAGSKIASASVIIPATTEWTKFTGEFNYTNDDPVGTCFLLASATTNPLPGASQDDQLDLDELHLIYYSTLSDLTIDGKTIEGFAPDKYEYTISGDIKEMFGKVGYTAKSKFANVVVEDDFQEGTVKLYVRGNDYSVNNDNVTVYTITFKKPVEDGIDTISAETAKNHEVYTLGGVRVSGKPAAGVYVVDGKKMEIR